MKLSEFITLSDEKKRSIVWTEGVVVATRTVIDRTVLLFQFPHYYVETFCSETNPEFQEYQVFQDTRHLAPYLESISIGHLLV